jgi:CheY-like chemotaxis protein
MQRRTETKIFTKSILFVDDDEDDRVLFQTALSCIDEQIDFTEACDGIAALEILNNANPPDAIFLDLNMPKLSGFDLLSAIKKMDRFKKTPIIIFTTSSSFSDKAQAFKLGASDFITKPYTFRDLCKVIEEAVKKTIERPSH